MEERYPLAFSILAHANIGILETILATTFRPHNAYCIYIDNKASAETVQLVEGLINCYKYHFPEAVIFLHPEPRINIYWGHYSSLEAQLSCLEQLTLR